MVFHSVPLKLSINGSVAFRFSFASSDVHSSWSPNASLISSKDALTLNCISIRLTSLLIFASNEVIRP